MKALREGLTASKDDESIVLAGYDDDESPFHLTLTEDMVSQMKAFLHEPKREGYLENKGG